MWPSDCRLSVVCVQYGIIVAIILEVIVVWNCGEILIVTCSIFSAWQRLHVRLVVFLKPQVSGTRLLLKLPVVHDRYYCLCCVIQLFERGIDVLFELLQKMSFKNPYMILYRWFSLRFSRRRRNDDCIVELLQILEGRVKNQFILRMLCDSRFQVVRNEVFGNAP